ncbi:MAG TPA: hypothetical protein VGI10_22285 [Polyangiaceae bacterium]|jgi:hypothetical protein
MQRTIIWGAFLFVAVSLSACGSHDTELGQASEPLNGVSCGKQGEVRGTCACFSDGRWLCAGQQSVTCAALFASGGGRLLVNRPNPDPIGDYQSEWSNCSDGRVYGVTCDGLFCKCSVDRAETGREFLSPRGAEISETSEGCGFSLQYPAGVGAGSGPVQGMPCASPGSADASTGCVCDAAGWDCPVGNGCRFGGNFQSAGGAALQIMSDGTWGLTAGSSTSTAGTWQLNWDGSHLSAYVLSIGDATCESSFATYDVSYASSCGSVTFSALNEPCAARGALLDGFQGARE